MTNPDNDPAAYPDMDAIRAAHNAPAKPAPYTPPPRVTETSGNVAIDAFRASMRMDYDKWNDGIGYDIDVLRDATPDEQAALLTFLIPASGWRDVEALAAIDSDAARAALRKAMDSRNPEVRGAVLRYAPTIASEDERTTVLVKALQHGAFFQDLTGALELAETFHPPRVMHALFRGLFARPGEIATHYAAMLAFIHGKADSAFDWEYRPLFLEFNSDDGADRERAFVKLCALLEIDPLTTRAEIGTHNED